MVPDIEHYPIAIGLFGAIGVVMIPQDLSNLIHGRSLGSDRNIFEFSMLSTLSCNTWKSFHLS